MPISVRLSPFCGVGSWVELEPRSMKKKSTISGGKGPKGGTPELRSDQSHRANKTY